MKLQEADMLQAGKYLLSCLMGAIDKGMGAKYGAEWFDVFKAREKEEKIPVITGEKCLEDLDLQACLKLFKFRSEYRDAVLSHFGFYDLGTDTEKKERRNTFTQAVTRLIDNFRNRYMHLSAGSAESEWRTDLGDTTYGVAEAISDMKDVSKYFLTVRDPSGVPYYDRICECEARYSEDKRSQMYSITGEMSSKAFKGYKDDDFIRACNELNIPVEKGDNDELYYYSSDHDETLGSIKRQMSHNRESGAGSRRKSALITGICVAGAAVVTGVLIFTFAGMSDKESVTGVSAEEFHPSGFREGDIDPEEAEKLVLFMRECAADMSFDEYKQFYTKKYREDDALDDYIENEQMWLKGVSDCGNYLFIPVVRDDNMLGASAVFYGKPGDPEYRKARLFTFANEDNSLKVALEKIAAVSKYTGDYPEGFNSAVSENRNFYIADEEDYSFKDGNSAFKGIETIESVLVWAEPDGSVSILMHLANGTDAVSEYKSIHVSLAAGSDSSTPNKVLYEGDVDLRRSGKAFVLEPGKGADLIVNIKKDSLSEGAALCDWGNLKVEAEKYD